MLAPIVLFVYNRPLHTKQVLIALSKNYLADKSHLFIYSDGKKKNASDKEAENIRKVRNIIRVKLWCKEVTIIEHKQNNGLHDSIIKGVTEIVNEYGKIIVLEDDIVTSKGFLKYMNEALQLYINHKEVMSVSGYTFPTTKKLPDTFFLKGGTSTWGWGTWKNAWFHFEKDSKKLLENLLKLDKKNIRKFNFSNNYDYIGMLKDQIDGKNNSWGVKWYTSVFLNNGLGLYPKKSLVNNIGFDDSGTHCGTLENFNHKKLENFISVKQIELKENTKSRKVFECFYKKNKISLLMKIKIKIKQHTIKLYEYFKY